MHPLKTVALVAALVFPSSLVAGHGDDIGKLHDYEVVRDENNCTTVVYKYNFLLHKPKYRVAVYANEGNDEAYRKYQTLFEDYLTATAGRKFDPPLQFEMVPVTQTDLVHLAEEEEVDFMFSSSSVYSCLATEKEAQALVTVINRRKVRGYEYDLDEYGGVMFTLAGNKDINVIEDFQERTIGAASITAMGGGQSQFYEMYKRGMSYISDPKQVVFTGNEALVVQGVLDGDFEVGFARTDQIERHTDENGEPLDEDTFKVINSQTLVMDNGQMFPFMSSTALHPEWPVAALDHVDRGVSKQVQEALLALADHISGTDHNHENMRCDTTPLLAELAQKATTSGQFTGFRTARSYMGVRTKQEGAHLMRYHGDEYHCIRGDTLYEDIECPDHFYKVERENFDRTCEMRGMPCKEGYKCFCHPCIKAFEVDVFQYIDELHADRTHHVTDLSKDNINQIHCEKMSMCGEIEQTKEVVLRAIDNLKREDPEIAVIVHLDHESILLDVQEVEPFTYDFNFTYGYEGVEILEIFFNGVQIPESPLRLKVVRRDCEMDYPGHHYISAENGQCICSADTYDVAGDCIDKQVFAIAGALTGVVLLAILGFFYMRYKNKKADEMWQVELDELSFDDPVEVIGQGSFGIVLLGEYRGTKVAIKRAVAYDKKGSMKKRLNESTMGGVSMMSVDDIEEGNIDIEGNATLDGSADATRDVEAGGKSGEMSTKWSDHFTLGFMTEDFGQRGARALRKWERLFPWCFQSHRHRRRTRVQEAILGNSMSSTGAYTMQVLCPWFSERARRHYAFEAEMRVLARLRHPCITTVMGAVVARRHEPMLVMEYMDYGSLHELLRNETFELSGEIILQITRDLAQGLRYLHSSKPPILHGDLKARNLLIDSRFRAKLCDFGLSSKTSGSISGTPFWMAPEYLRGDTHYDAACDIYSVGIILFEIYARKSPYSGEEYRSVIRGVCNRRVNKRPDLPKAAPQRFQELMKKCWHKEASSRPAAKELDLTFMDMQSSDAEPIYEEGMRPKRRDGDMLYELFPRHVADQIKNNQKVEPESHDLVTVVFSDIVHFTDISRSLSPEKVCDMLDRLYMSFDECARKHSVFKVETIGDAYMGVTNLEGNMRHNHVKNICEFAVDIINAAAKIAVDTEDDSFGFIKIRVGLHSGPVVSNVIGSLNKRYGLFGDTVNTASRMESNSKPMRILCSERSHTLLKEQAPTMKQRCRGTINVKGKGDMNVFWVGDNLIDRGAGRRTPGVIAIRDIREKSVAFADEEHYDTGSSCALSFHDEPPVPVEQAPAPLEQAPNKLSPEAAALEQKVLDTFADFGRANELLADTKGGYQSGGSIVSAVSA